MAIGMTSFERKDSTSGEWDRIGTIEWTSPLTGTVQFGDEEVITFTHVTPYLRLTRSLVLDRHERFAKDQEWHKHVRDSCSHLSAF